MIGSVLILLSHFVIGAYAPSGIAAVGPFDLIFTSLGKCPTGMSDESQIIFEAKLKRVSRNKLIINANVSLLTPVTDDYDVHINMAKQTNQGWKDNFFIIDIPHICTALKTYIPSTEKELARQAHYRSGTCPIPSGNFSITIPFSIDLKLVPVFTYGKYRGRFFIQRKQRKLLCLETVVESVPKKTG